MFSFNLPTSKSVFCVLLVSFVLAGCSYFQQDSNENASIESVTDSSGIDLLSPSPQPTFTAAPPDSIPPEQEAAEEAAEETIEETAVEETAVNDSLLALVTVDSTGLVSVPAEVLLTLLTDLAAIKAGINEEVQESEGDSDLQDQLQHLGRNVLLSLLTILVFFYIIRAISWTLERFSEQSATRRLFFKRLVPIVRIVIWSLAIYIILMHVFALKESQLISAWAAIGLAVGFASQDILKNIFGGIIIIIDQPFQVGDKINIGGTYGEVKSIGLRSTRIVTPDDNLVSVPNAQVVESQVANANAGALDCQVVIDLYLPGWVDVLQAKAIAYNAAANSNYVYLEKPIVVNIKDEFKETFLTHLAVKAYVIDTRYEFAFASDVTETAKAEFQRKGMLTPMSTVLAFGYTDKQNGSSDSPVEKS